MLNSDLDQFMLALGKALYLASEYEAKCQWVLHIARLEDEFAKGQDRQAAAAMCRAMKKKLLHAALSELQQRPPGVRASDFGLLDKAREARNFIVHEAGQLGELWCISEQNLAVATTRLRMEVANLARGDRIVTSWVLSIQEGEPGAFGMFQEYVGLVNKWVFEGGAPPP